MGRAPGVGQRSYSRSPRLPGMLIRPVSPATASGQIAKSSLARPLVCGAAATRLGLLPCGCKRSPSPAPAGAASASASVAAPDAPAAEPSRCRRLSAYALTLEEAPLAGKGRQAAAEDEPEDEALLPFGVD